MDSALIISYSNKVADSLAEILAQASVADITTLSTAGSKEDADRKEFDLYIINTPLPDEFGESLALNIASKGINVVILLVRPNFTTKYRQSRGLWCHYGCKTHCRTLFWNALKLAIAAIRSSKPYIMKIRNLFRR